MFQPVEITDENASIFERSAPVDYKNQNTLFGIMDSIAQESKNASRIKSEYPIMCVIGNPPYSGESMNANYTDNNVYKIFSMAKTSSNLERK
jgi:predicted helicase